MGESTKIDLRSKSANGVTNWLFVMLIITFSILVMENFKRFGIIKQPFEIAHEVFHTICNHWWLYGIVLLCILQQMIHTFIIEKLLFKKYLSERVGMMLHALNAFFLATTFVIFVRTNKANIGVVRLMASYILSNIVKVWSYAYVNSVFRKNISKKEDDKLKSTYPSNITLYNLLIYMLFTPFVQYKLAYPNRTSPNWKKFIIQLLFAFTVICMMSFVAVQFLIPELHLLKIQKLNGIEAVQCLCRIMVFVHLIWLLGYIIWFRIYLPTYAQMTGMGYLVLEKDWWNSPHLDEFWRRWNNPVYTGLKETVMLPLLQNNYSKRTAIIIVFLIAGVLHEFINTLPMGIYNGTGILVTLTEIPIGYLSRYASQKFGTGVSNILVWIYIHVTYTTSIVCLHLHYNVL